MLTSSTGPESRPPTQLTPVSPRKLGILLASLPLLFSIVFAQDLTQGTPSSQTSPRVDFETSVRPILSGKCHRCHGSELQLGGLRLDQRKAALSGGYSGPVILPGESAQSKLIQLVSGEIKGKLMPLDGPRLTPAEVALLRLWIDQGADWPETALSAEAASTEEAPRRQTHWSLRPPERPELPHVMLRSWVRNPIDTFVLERLESEGTTPSPEAARSTLIRRLYLDLIGLPPPPEALEAFLADHRPDAYERLVTHLLSSSHYGEKWARHWLDLARYADSDGYNDGPRPHAWRYRHWVIQALNGNLPFDQFTIQQMAGDLLPDATVEQRVATGFHRNTLTQRETGTDREEFRVKQIVDRANTVGAVWLGLTVGCAQCHDHKYDPITQKEYYRLYAFFNGDKEVNIEAPLPGEMGPYLQQSPEYQRRRRELLDQYPALALQPQWEARLLEAASTSEVDLIWTLAWRKVGWLFDGGQEILRLDPSQRTQKQKDQLSDYFVGAYNHVVDKGKYEELGLAKLKEELVKMRAEFPSLSEAQTLIPHSHPPTTHLHLRGDFRNPGIEVRPGTPAVLHPLLSQTAPTRLELAQWLVSKKNPLTARVTVNRMWQEFFGTGLVGTAGDFGVRGERPSHPKLLDWLATEFMSSGWNLKQMHRLIVESATYRQASKLRLDLQELDPANRLLARQTRLRLSAELIRDSVLAASNLLYPVVGGKSILPPLPKGLADLGHRFQGWEKSQGKDRYRRGLYVLAKRTAPYPQLMVFDAPDAQESCTRRERSTTALQALNLLNDPVFFEAAQALAIRLLQEESGDVQKRLEYGFQVCLAREPNSTETDRLLRYYEQQREILRQEPASIAKVLPLELIDKTDPASAAAWVGVSSVLLNLEEFITRE